MFYDFVCDKVVVFARVQPGLFESSETENDSVCSLTRNTFLHHSSELQKGTTLNKVTTTV